MFRLGRRVLCLVAVSLAPPGTMAATIGIDSAVPGLGELHATVAIENAVYLGVPEETLYPDTAVPGIQGPSSAATLDRLDVVTSVLVSAAPPALDAGTPPEAPEVLPLSIPEPSSLKLLMFGAGLMLIGRRRLRALTATRLSRRLPRP